MSGQNSKRAYQLELDWHQPKVDNLDYWPNQEIGLESRKVHIAELVGYSSSSAALCNSHDREKYSDS